MKLKRICVKKNKTQAELNTLYDTIRGMDPSSAEYSAIADQIVKLESVRNEQRNVPSADGLISVIGSVASLLLVLNAEEIKNKILTGRAFNFIRKIR